MNPSLFEKLGGKDTVAKASHILYVNILRDEKLKPYFKDIDITKQSRKMNAFLTYIFGGNSLYTGRSMRKAHKELSGQGLTDEHVDAMIDCVCMTLKELEIDSNTIGEVAQAIDKHRDDVLNR